MEEFGYFLGRWVYLMDAGDDFEKDRQKGDFNVFVKKYGPFSPGKLSEEEEKRVAVSINELQNMNTARIQAALALMPLQAFAPTIQNIVCLGLPYTQRSVLFTHTYRKGTKIK